VLGVVLQRDAEDLLDVALDLVVDHVALVLEDLDDGGLEVGGGHLDDLVPGRLAVADAGEHVRDGIRPTH